MEKVINAKTFQLACQENEISVSEQQLEQLQKYMDLLLEWNEKMNLTARIGSVIKDKEYSLLDVGIAVEHFCLQASELGLGTCILGWFDEKKVRKLLKIERRRVPLLITVGYPDSPVRKKVRKKLDEMSCWNVYED